MLIATSEKQIAPEKVTQIFVTTVYGGAANIVGNATHSPVNFNITSNDFGELKQLLQENGVEEVDIAELKQAITEDAPPTEKEKFGPRVSGWIGKMARKSAEGSWNVGIATAGNLLSQAISKFYGL